MKLKPCKEKKAVSAVLKDIYSVSQQVSPTSVTIDVDGCVTLENFKRLINYNKDMIAMETRDKTVYIYGEKLVVTACNRYSAVVRGCINSIELFPKEVDK